MHLWLFEALNAYRILNLSHGHIPAPWRDLWQSPTLNISLNYDFFVNVLNIGWHRDTNYQLLQIVQTWMEDGFLWMFLDTTPALRGISPLSLNPLVMYEKRFLQCCALKRCFFDAALKTRSLIIYPSERQERTEDGSMAGPRKWLEAPPNANQKEFHGIPT